jgi:hypothetical protein
MWTENNSDVTETGQFVRTCSGFARINTTKYSTQKLYILHAQCIHVLRMVLTETMIIFIGSRGFQAEGRYPNWGRERVLIDRDPSE